MASSWPGQMRTVYGDHQGLQILISHNLMENILLAMDVEGTKMVIIGLQERSVIIVSGHNLGTAEIEVLLQRILKLLKQQWQVFRSIKGNGLYCYVTLNAGENPTGDLERDLKQWVRKQIGPICYPDVIQFARVCLKLDLGK